MDHVSLFIVIGVILLFSFKGVILSQIFKFQTIKPAHAKELIQHGKATLVDVRTPEEYLAGHLPGSRSIPLSTFSEQMNTLSKELPVIVVCQSGARSLIAAAKLGRAGYRKAYSVNGGILGW